VIPGANSIAVIQGQLPATAIQRGHPGPVDDTSPAACRIACHPPLATLNGRVRWCGGGDCMPSSEAQST